jgi:predicted TIM-barrel fold metal-dependent hydrolase
MIVDTHVHIWEIDPPRYPVGPTAPGWNSLPDEPATVDELLEDMDANSVDRTVLVQTSWSTWDNGYIADSVARFPERFVGQGLIDPQDANNAKVARYWMRERGLVGFRLHPMYYPDEQILLAKTNEPLWEELAALGAIVQFHMRAADARQVGEIARRFPQLKLLIDHMGYPDLEQGKAAFEPIVALAQFANIHVKVSDVAGRSKEAFPFVDVHPYIRMLYDAFGSARLLWGTGYPGHHRTKHNWLTLADELRLVREGIPFLGQRDQEQVLGGTAAAIWGWAT